MPKPHVTLLDFEVLAEKLAEYEDQHAVMTGTRVSSAEFHDLYLAGDTGDVPYAMEWASYYELMREHGRRALDDKSVADGRARSVAVA